MNHQIRSIAKLVVPTATLLLFAACATPLTAPQGADTARSKLTELQSSPELANLAPIELKEAEAAVIAAEVPRIQDAYAAHLVLIADQKVDIAAARAQSRLYEDQRTALSEESELARLEARTLEADRAHADATAARDEAELATEEMETAKLESEELKRQVEELNARETDRGLVVTLGDLLFETGGSDLKGGATSNLDKLVLFLQEYPDRTVLIEGHTDDVGSDDFNFDLSNRRADAVQSYLAGRGVEPGRLSSTGLGEGSPIAGNDTATGRQQNRRVEIIISNATTASTTS